MKKKLVQVEFVYDDGSISKLVGNEADKWDKAMSNVMWCYQNHGNKFPKFDWIVKENFMDISNDRYHKRCYETSCKGNLNDLCIIPNKIDFEKYCPFKIVERHKGKTLGSEPYRERNE